MTYEKHEVTNMENIQRLTKRERREIRRQEKLHEEIKRRDSQIMRKWAKIAITIVIVGLGIGGIVWYGSSRPVVPTGELLSVKADDWIKGNSNAQTTLVEYLDFECEACGQYYPLLKRLSEEFKDDVRFVNRYFPLPGHKNSLTSAAAVEAAGKQEKYWEMYNIVFENQSSWGEKQSPEPAIFEGYAQQLGLDLVKFKQDVTSGEVKDRIERDKDTGDGLNIQSTPTFFLNGEKIQNPRGYEDFKILLQEAINKAKSIK